jgi:excisionase family DNA binding protein
MPKSAPHEPQAARGRVVLVLPSEAAKLVGLCSKTLSRMADRGELTVRKTIGGHRRYNLADLDALVEQLNENLSDVA